MSNINNQRISIIIVTYNAAATLQACLDSIYTQTYLNIEIIVVDGDSTDGTIDIIKSNDLRLAFWKSGRDRGVYDAMNKGLQHVTGEWIYFLGADDELTSEFSNLAYELNNPSVIYYGSVLKNGEKYLGRLAAYHHAKTGICHQAMIYPARVFRKYRFDLNYPISSDHVLNMWCWKDETFCFEFRDLIIAKFNHTGISSLRKDAIFERDKAKLIRDNYGVLIWLRFVFKRFKESMRRAVRS